MDRELIGDLARWERGELPLDALRATHGARAGALVELNCETDFVARNPRFRELAHEIAMQVAAMSPTHVGDEAVDGEGVTGDNPLLEQAYIRDASKTIRDLIREAIASFGENVVIRRFVRYELGG